MSVLKNWKERRGRDRMESIASSHTAKSAAPRFRLWLQPFWVSGSLSWEPSSDRRLRLGLFVALPFCLGLFSVLVYSYHEPRSYSSCMSVSLVPMALLGAVLILVMIEGLVCILMAAPFALGLAALGGMLGYAIQAGYWLNKDTPVMLSIILLFTPAFQGADRWVTPPAETFEVRTA